MRPRIQTFLRFRVISVLRLFQRGEQMLLRIQRDQFEKLLLLGQGAIPPLDTALSCRENWPRRLLDTTAIQSRDRRHCAARFQIVFQSICRRRMEAGTLQSSGRSDGRGCNFRAEIIFPYQSFDLLGVVSLAYVPFHLQLLQFLQFLHRAQRFWHPILRVIVESLIFLVNSAIMFRHGRFRRVGHFFWITMKLYLRNLGMDRTVDQKFR